MISLEQSSLCFHYHWRPPHTCIFITIVSTDAKAKPHKTTPKQNRNTINKQSVCEYIRNASIANPTTEQHIALQKYKTKRHAKHELIRFACGGQRETASVCGWNGFETYRHACKPRPVCEWLHREPSLLDQRATTQSVGCMPSATATAFRI